MKLVKVSVAALCTASLAVGVLGAPASGGPRTIDPSSTGPYPVDEIDYRGGHVVFQDPNGMPVVEELKGTLHLPDSDKGPWPLIVFVHGRHSTCRVLDRTEIIFAANPCPEARPVTSEVTSYRGYDYLAHNLASHGYVVASASANAINSYDFPVSFFDSGMEWRAQLVGETLDLFADWNRRPGPREVGSRLIGQLDFDRIGLMGHSRGGEGVARFVTVNKNRTTGPTYKGLRAVFALAPTDFYDEKVPGVHFGTLVPLCDGDVYDLEGAWMYDAARYLKPRRFASVQFAVNGANHNFFNTVWTGDDGPGGGDDTGANRACDPEAPGNVRLTAAKQRLIGLDLMAAFFRRYLGGEKQLDPLMTGAAEIPSSACPRACRRTILTSYAGPGARVLLEPDQSGNDYTTSGKVDGKSCAPDLSGQGCPTVPNRSPARQLAISWRGAGALRVPLKTFDATRFDALTFRTAVNFSSELNKGRFQDFKLVLVDGSGRSASVRAAKFTGALEEPVGRDHQVMLLNGAWVPLDSFRGVDLSRLTRLELRFGALTKTGSIQLADVAFQRA